jgi:hypothetical protein
MNRKKKEKEERKTRMGMALFWFNLWCHVSSYTKTEKKKITEFTRRTKKESEFVSPSMVKRRYKLRQIETTKEKYDRVKENWNYLLIEQKSTE